MRNSRSPWVRDLIVLPVMVGFAVTFFAFVLPILFPARIEISYYVQGPTRYLTDNKGAPPRPSRIDCAPGTILVGFEAILWNSGKTPLENIPVTIRFAGGSPLFRVLHDRIETTPPLEFGDIRALDISDDSYRYTVGLLNPGDEIRFILLTNESASLEVYAKAKGLSVRKAFRPRDR